MFASQFILEFWIPFSHSHNNLWWSTSNEPRKNVIHYLTTEVEISENCLPLFKGQFGSSTVYQPNRENNLDPSSKFFFCLLAGSLNLFKVDRMPNNLSPCVMMVRCSQLNWEFLSQQKQSTSFCTNPTGEFCGIQWPRLVYFGLSSTAFLSTVLIFKWFITNCRLLTDHSGWIYPCHPAELQWLSLSNFCFIAIIAKGDKIRYTSCYD